jgi:hypothetical protein
VFLASAIGGRIGSLYESISPAAFWLLHAAITSVGAALFLLLRPAVRRTITAME